jgi:3-oxoacyl-(acyl-carrier-protein) synthase
MVSPVGCGVEASWANLLGGANGARRIEEFEVSDIACQIGCFIPRGEKADGKFHPDDWMGPKEQRGSTITFMMAATEQAIMIRLGRTRLKSEELVCSSAPASAVCQVLPRQRSC